MPHVNDADKAAARWVLSYYARRDRKSFANRRDDRPTDAVRVTIDCWVDEMGNFAEARDALEARAREALGDE